jgi:FkbM family methyltransferase
MVCDNEQRRQPVLASCVRGLLFPMRWAVATLPRGSFFRSASVPVLKAVSHRSSLLASLREIRPLDRSDISFDATDSWVLDDVYWFGVQGYEGLLAEVWTELCRRATSILEIGGNVGLYSVLGGKATQGKYTVVEPLPEVAAMLRSNLRRNRLQRVEVLEGAAIPDVQSRDVILSVPDAQYGAPTGAHLVERSEVATQNSRRNIVAPGFPILSLLEGRDLIKLDAEGIEHALLTTAMPILLKRRPTIVVEVLPDSTRLAAVLSEIATSGKYVITIVPAYGTGSTVSVAATEFTAATPGRFNSKDVVLSTAPFR